MSIYYLNIMIQFAKLKNYTIWRELSIDQESILLSLEIITESQGLRASNHLQIVYPSNMAK